MKKKTLLFLVFCCNFAVIYCGILKRDVDLVVTTTEETEITTAAADYVKSPDKETGLENAPPQITELSVDSNVTNRFAKTVVKSKVKNPADKAQETTFFVVLPDQAYISGFVMEIGGKNYTAYVQDKAAAKKTYDQAVASGIGAAHVAVSARDSNKFTVSTNVEPEGKATFYLTYEELLDRKDGYYELVINIHPKQLVKDLNVKVHINEQNPLSFVRTPSVRSGNEIAKETDDLNSKAAVEVNDSKAEVNFHPDYEQQKQIAKVLGTKEDEGMAGQFVVQYDVQRDPNGGEVLLKDGYFVHFFAPSDLKPLVKHIVFVLDTSGSMYDRKIEQLKTAMGNILGELKPEDYFNLVEFNTNVKVWNLDAPAESTQFPESDAWYVSDQNHDLTGVSFPPAYPVNNNTVSKANKSVTEMYPTGGTNIYEALRVGLHLIKLRRMRTGDTTTQPLILFLTDGDPTVGRTIPKSITSGISEENIFKVPIISLSFGEGADRSFLKQLSSSNFGFARHIYEDSDASLQLENFYKEISSPLLHDVKFKYTDDAISLTQTNYPILYSGDEIVVAGRYTGSEFESPVVECFGVIGPVNLKPVVKQSVGQLERLWAYLTVKKHLADKELNESDDSGKKALDLALKYSFVTPVTSLVVVKPNETNRVEAEAADKKNYNFDPGSSIGGVRFGGAGMLGPMGINFQQPGIRLKAASIPALAPQSAFAPPPPQFLPGPPQFMAPALGIPEPDSLDSDRIVGGLASPIYSLMSSGPTHQFTTTYKATNNFQSTPYQAYYTEATVAAEVTTEVVEPIQIPDEIKTALPWLENSLRTDGTLNFFKGHYEMGFNHTSPEDLQCTDPQSQNGQCKLVKDCPVLYAKLTSPQLFKDYFCSIEQKFAGVCCPKTK